MLSHKQKNWEKSLFAYVRPSSKYRMGGLVGLPTMHQDGIKGSDFLLLLAASAVNLKSGSASLIISTY